MKLTAILYELDLKEEFRSAGGRYRSRRGVLLRAENPDHGVAAWGEAAPLPGFSRETPEEVLEQAGALATNIRELLSEPCGIDETGVFHRRNEVLPSLRFALDTLWTDLESRRQDTAPGTLLFNSWEERVAMNGVLPVSGDPDRTLDRADRLAEEGYGTLKVKLDAEPEVELQILELLRQRRPELKLRADANRGWTFERAAGALDRLAGLGLEYCEEPLENCSREQFSELSRQSAVPLALDETLFGEAFEENLLEFTDFIILKPMVAGGLSDIFAIKALADQYDNTVIFTSSLEGGTGRAMTALLAGGVGSARHAHGLATGMLFQTDFAVPPDAVVRGNMRVPPGPGFHPPGKEELKRVSLKRTEL